ncbi:hypothetical protein SNE40_009015 [Patella caerulea]|uniref:Polycystin cation channel PKD1/PKD2 domain-containing protein n=1 Tax=Patella caerulea TaxID=87958 RepID=A0AAN8JN22_PATCE
MSSETEIPMKTSIQRTDNAIGQLNGMSPIDIKALLAAVNKAIVAELHVDLQKPSRSPVADDTKEKAKNSKDTENISRKLKKNKWRAAQKCISICIFLVEMGVVMAQVIIFARFRSGRAEYLEGNELAFKHLFLEDWSASYETMPYPPAEGDYAVYTKQGFYDHLNYIISQYYELPAVTIGTFRWDTKNLSQSQPPLINLCEKHFKTVMIFENDTHIVDSHILTECFDIKVTKEPNGTIIPDIKGFLDSVNHTILFSRLISVEMSMLFKCYHIDTSYENHNPDCFNTAVNVWFDNGQRDGQMKVGLHIKRSDYPCKETPKKNHSVIFDAFVIFIVIVSLCAHICFEYTVGIKEPDMWLDDKTTWTERLVWNIIMLVGDGCVLAGSAIKIGLDTRRIVPVPANNYDVCSICIGIGFLLVWIGFIRYLKYLTFGPKTNNMTTILVKTLKDATPDALRFLFSSSSLFVGFILCGWVVLSPYNIKFRSVSSSAECLFSLMDGDELYVTLQATEADDCPAIWYFSRGFLYLFSLLFVCLVLNLFTAIFLHAYERLKSTGTDDAHNDGHTSVGKSGADAKNDGNSSEGNNGDDTADNETTPLIPK